MDNQNLIGKLSAWNSERGFGFIVVEKSGFFSKFYLHCSRIVAGREQAGLNSAVMFRVSPVREGKFPSAIDAIISAPSETVEKADAAAGLSALTNDEAVKS